MAEICRVCLCNDKRMYVITKSLLQEIWERLTKAEVSSFTALFNPIKRNITRATLEIILILVPESAGRSNAKLLRKTGIKYYPRPANRVLSKRSGGPLFCPI